MPTCKNVESFASFARSISCQALPSPSIQRCAYHSGASSGGAAGASSTGSVNVHVPSGTPRGTYFLLACSDQTAVVVESSDSNNCRAAMTSVIVK